jgi:CubicO group peptidase (beta-lactamase class C family)
VPGSTRTLGWDTPSPRNSSAGTKTSSRTVGHLGFTGVSLWMDLDRGVRVVLLTNRVHPSRDNDKLADFRPRIHDLVMGSL